MLCKGNCNNRKLIACGCKITAMVDISDLLAYIYIYRNISHVTSEFFFIANIKKLYTVSSNWPVIGAIDEKNVFHI